MIDTKKIYSEWLDYCKLCVEDMTDRDEAREVAGNSLYVIYYSEAWDLVCSVRDWDPDLFEEAEEEKQIYRGGNGCLTEMIAWTSYVMTRMKIEHYMDAKEEEDA